jgi:hypothetical protein
MTRRSCERGLTRNVHSVVVLCCLLHGCGSNVVVADQGRHSDASQAADAGDFVVVDAGALPNVTLCGSSRCTDFSLVIPGAASIQLYACCLDPRASTCGVVEGAQCVQLNYPGHPDSTQCQSLPPFTGAGQLQGCCRADGTCGVLDTKYGFGCAQITFITGNAPCTY